MREVARLAVTEGENISDCLLSPSLASFDTHDKKIKEKEKNKSLAGPTPALLLLFFKGRTSSHYLFICVLLSAFMIA